jgi:hypothetical protein
VQLRLKLLLFGTIAGAACGGGGDDDDGPVVTPPAPNAFIAAGGSGQRAIAGTTLPVPYTILVTDGAAQPVAGASVSWATAAGSGSVSEAASTTDAAGHASVLHTLGPLPGSQTVSATLGATTASPVVFSTTALGSAAAVRVAEVAIPPNYGIHDTFVRDGLAFVCAWSTGLIIYDVGHGVSGGSPSSPVEVSRIVPARGAVSGLTGAIHNAWWFHNPVSGEKRYVFLGQEGPGVIGSGSQGDIYVVDVSDLAHPQQVASFGLAGAGTHNFWVDEAAQVLYAAYYNGGVVAIDVSGTLSGDLSSRLIAQVKPGGDDSTYTWGVQVANGSVYASDMVTGLWQLSLANAGMGVLSGRRVLDRWTSDLWVTGGFAFTGTWGGSPRRDSTGTLNPGNALKIWLLQPWGAPVGIPDSLILDGVGTVSDVEVSADGRRLLLTAERGPAGGFFLYDLADPLNLRFVASAAEAGGLHTGTFAKIGGRDFVFAARNPGDPALVIYDVTGALQ